MKKKYQIGVIGSTADLKYLNKSISIAEKIGYWIAKNNAILIYGAEKDYDSLSTAACCGAKKAGGLTVGITYNKGMNIYDNKNTDVIIATGLERGGGRELSLILSCNAIITLNGGSGTLTELAIAYQANIPIVAIKNSGGWSEKLTNQYLDPRKRVKIIGADNAKNAVDLAIKLIKKYEKK